MSEVYKIVTERISEMLSKGTVPWRKPWTGSLGVPTSWISGKPYSGINRILLDPMFTGFASPYWITFNQVSKHGGKVKAGSKSNIVCHYSMFEKQDNGVVRKIPVFRYYRVFNLEQTEGIQAPKGSDVQVVPHNPIAQCEAVVNGWQGKPIVEHATSGRCYYTPSADRVTMMPLETFEKPEGYYATMFHELVHSTGHKTRLDRLTVGDRSDYAEEELVAEIGSQFLCEHTGINNTELGENSGAYIAGWLKVLKNNPKMVVTCASKAQKAFEMIVGTPEAAEAIEQ